MKSEILIRALHERFNHLNPGDTLDSFTWFEIMPCKLNTDDDTVSTCEVGDVEFWTIYGRENVGTEYEPEFHAIAIHDESDAWEIVRIARQIALETGKGFVVGCAAMGQFPRRNGQVVPVNDFTEIAEDLTTNIHEDLWEQIEPADRRDDDFENHPFTPMREALTEYSFYLSATPRDPYQEGTV